MYYNQCCSILQSRHDIKKFRNFALENKITLKKEERCLHQS